MGLEIRLEGLNTFGGGKLSRGAGISFGVIRILQGS